MIIINYDWEKVIKPKPGVDFSFYGNFVYASPFRFIYGNSNISNTVT